MTYSASATDWRGRPVVVSCEPTSGAVFPLGRTTVTCSATDRRDSRTTGSFGVIVVDTTPPVVTPPADVTLGGGARPATDPAISAFLGAVTAVDVVDPRPMISHTAPARFEPGATRVTFAAVDRSGNRTERSALVTITADEAGRTPLAPPVAVDRTAPRDVRQLVVKPGNHVATLRWLPPADADFARVVITRSHSTTTNVQVYSGAASVYRDRGLRNGVAYRYTVASYDRAGNRSAGLTRLAIPRAILLLGPKDGARLTSPPLLRWRPVRTATYYNVQLFRGGRKILSAWPRRSRLQLRRTWGYGGFRQQLRRGRYRWYVWPGFGSGSRVRYGALLGARAFVVLSPRDLTTPGTGP